MAASCVLLAASWAAVEICSRLTWASCTSSTTDLALASISEAEVCTASISSPMTSRLRLVFFARATSASAFSATSSMTTLTRPT